VKVLKNIDYKQLSKLISIFSEDLKSIPKISFSWNPASEVYIPQKKILLDIKHEQSSQNAKFYIVSREKMLAQGRMLSTENSWESNLKNRFRTLQTLAIAQPGPGSNTVTVNSFFDHGGWGGFFFILAVMVQITFFIAVAFFILIRAFTMNTSRHEIESLSINNPALNIALRKNQKIREGKYFWILSSIQSYQITLLFFFTILDFRASVFDWIGRISLINLFFPSEVIHDHNNLAAGFGFGSNTNNLIVVNPINQCLPPLVLLLLLFLARLCFRNHEKGKSVLYKLRQGVYYAYLLPNLLIVLASIVITFNSNFKLHFGTIVAYVVALFIVVIYCCDLKADKNFSMNLLNFDMSKIRTRTADEEVPFLRKFKPLSE